MARQQKQQPDEIRNEKTDATSNGEYPPGFTPGPPDPADSNRDHPTKVGARVTVPGQGIEHGGANAPDVGNDDLNYTRRRGQKPDSVPPVHIAQRERAGGVGSAESSGANGSVAPLSPPTRPGDDVGPTDPANGVPGINDPNYTAATYPEGERREEASKMKAPSSK